MCRIQKAFTLVELLVVIAIIALLLSILMPSLAKVRDQARQVVCQSNNKQWGLAFTMYTGDNNGKFMSGVEDNQVSLFGPPDNLGQSLWWVVLKSYGMKDNKVRSCPSALKPMSQSAKQDQMCGWGVVGTGTGFQESYSAVAGAQGDYGSYGFNNWLYNMKPISAAYDKLYWRTINVQKDASKIPMLTEAVWPSIRPWRSLMKPPLVPNIFSGDGANQIRRAIVNRHNGKKTTLYVDLSAKTETLKQMWVMRWSQEYISGEYLVQNWKVDAPWMKDFPEPKY